MQRPSHELEAKETIAPSQTANRGKSHTVQLNKQLPQWLKREDEASAQHRSNFIHLARGAQRQCERCRDTHEKHPKYNKRNAIRPRKTADRNESARCVQKPAQECTEISSNFWKFSFGSKGFMKRTRYARRRRGAGRGAEDREGNNTRRDDK